MKQFPLLFLFALISFSGYAQDTTVVQTLTFDSITTRRGVWQFPDSTHQYRKILMEYTLKCDAATTQDGFACGEWDYLTYTNVFDHTGLYDSNLIEHGKFQLANQFPDTIEYSTTPGFDVFQDIQYALVHDVVVNESVAILGTSLVYVPLPELATSREGRIQIFWPDSQLSQAGLLTGDIAAMILDVNNPGIEFKGLKIKMKNAVSNPASSGFINDGFTEVYHHNTTFGNYGPHRFNFLQNFNWTASGGIIVDFSFDKSGVNHLLQLKGQQATDTVTVYSGTEDPCLLFNGADWVYVPVSNLSGLISDEITISFWQYGDTAIQPQSDYLFEATNANNKRVLSTHLPWSNGNVYWDAGYSGSYDRIYKAANTNDYEGKWNHWAMTKNSVTGIMKIYLNGALWHSGSGKTKSMNGISKFKIGSNAPGSNFYDGLINEFRIWNMELDEATIALWMFRDIDGNHPNINNLIAYYPMDEGTGSQLEDVSGVTGDAWMMGSPQWKRVNGDELFKEYVLSDFVPDVSFVQGSYISHIDTAQVLDTIYHSAISLVEFELGTQSFNPIDTTWLYSHGWSYTYHADGSVLDSSWLASSGTIYNSILSYFDAPYEVIDRYEIGRFITPYGIGLDLGPDGFTWTYDVSDYAPLLMDDVEISAGNQQELIDLKFLMIEGVPARDVKEITRIWGARASYSFNALDGDSKLSNKTIDLNDDASSFKVKTRLTGHGHHSSNGSYPHCCEWWPNTHYLLVNTDTIADWYIWQEYDCAQNPVFPQGGTWPGSREGWCPGDKVKDNEFEITEYITGDTVQLDYDISDIPATNLGMGSGNYVMAMQLMQYGAQKFTLDAEIVDVISPNNLGYYSRINPICSDPSIIIRNTGATDLTSLSIEYWVAGGSSQTYSWSGLLKSMENEVVSLPVSSEVFWMGDSTNVFHVNISSPNGGVDEYADNNAYSTDYQIPDVYNYDIILLYRSNNFPLENWYEVRDITGNVVFSRMAATANTTYYDTLDLDPGCYTLSLVDSMNDGLSYWAWPNQGSGYMKIKKVGGGIKKYFESEFGHKILYSFTISGELEAPEIEPLFSAELFPNPTSGELFFDLTNVNEEITMELLDLSGRIIFSEKQMVNENYTHRFDISHLVSGTYLFRAYGTNINFNRKVVRN
jgi:hypothetical protein